jgi:hypothetical protein
LTADGLYKINDELNFICNPLDTGVSCPEGNVCLSGTSSILKAVGEDPRDKWTTILVFNNIFETMVYLIKILTYDNWSRVILKMVNSEYQGWLVTILFIPVLVLSVIIHGLIIANFLNTALKLKNKKVKDSIDPRKRWARNTEPWRTWPSPL